MSTANRRATYDIVVPTVGRASLGTLVDILQRQRTDRCRSLIIADDRAATVAPEPLPLPRDNAVNVVRSGGRGPAAARNAGLAVATATWVVFVDDDVVPSLTWVHDLEDDLDAAPSDVAGVQGRVHVPLPADRRPTDWERNVAGLEDAQWATADLAYRRNTLLALDGFDERFARAYREDSDLGLRVTTTGARIVRGRRTVEHPVRPAPWHVSISKQFGNADDALMSALHGTDWRRRAGAPAGRRPWHVATVCAGAIAASATVARRPSLAAAAGACWGALTADFLRRRVLPGPQTVAETAAMVITSIAIPPVAVAAWLAGILTARGAAPHPEPSPRELDAVLFDRDGTLVVDVPYNDDPEAVVLKRGAAMAVATARNAGMRVGIITNQSGVARGMLEPDDVAAVNARVDDLIGPFDVICVCAHAPEEACSCRKPAPGLVIEAASLLGTTPDRCAVIGDIGADVQAAEAAGAVGVLVPTAETRREEVAAARFVASTIDEAVDLLLSLRGAYR